MAPTCTSHSRSHAITSLPVAEQATIARAGESRCPWRMRICYWRLLTARPRGSVATYWPGTIRRTPDLPNVSQCTRSQPPFSALNSRITILKWSRAVPLESRGAGPECVALKPKPATCGEQMLTSLGSCDSLPVRRGRQRAAATPRSAVPSRATSRAHSSSSARPATTQLNIGWPHTVPSRSRRRGSHGCLR
eukprot:scaffold214409_cov33-Tisochrysis_lutea.AAC.2